jgi:hypothetical protein
MDFSVGVLNHTANNGALDDCDLRPFLDRDEEIAAFKGILGHPDQRIVLLQGAQGMGKSWLLNDLKRLCGERGVTSVLVDFSNPALAQPDRVIRLLGERIGGPFASAIGEAESNARRDFPGAEGGLASGARDLALGVPPGFGAGGAGATVEKSVEVGRDFIGRDSITISNSPITIFPGNTLALASEVIEARQNSAMRAALRDLLRQRRLAIFFDQYDNATDTVKNWLRYQILAWQLDEQDEFLNLWTIIAGDALPLLSDLVLSRRGVRLLKLGPLPRTDLRQYWVEQQGLSEQILDFALTGSAQNTATLIFILRNFAIGHADKIR